MKDLTERIAALSPEQRTLFEAKLKARGLSAPQPQMIPRRRQDYYRLSFDQERIWLVDQIEPGNPAYNIFSVSRLSGMIDVPLMERALNEVIRRHDILRTTFTTIDGEPRQVVTPSLFIPLELTDFRALPPGEREVKTNALLRESTSRSFDLSRGPLARFGLVRVEDAEFILHYTVHHTCIDRWSADIIEDELVAIYMAFAEGKPSPLPELPIQFADFAEWQRDWLQGETLAEQVAYWRKQLDGISHVLELPTDRPRPPMQTFNGARRTLMLPKSTLDGLKALTRAEQATMFMTCLAAYKTLLYRYTNQEDILVGVAVANRNRPETLSLIGYFLNMLVMRTSFSDNLTFREVLRREKESVTGAFAHGEFPFGRLMQELKPKHDPSRNPIFQVAYIYLDFEMQNEVQKAGFKATPVLWDNGSSRFEMTLALTDMTDGLEVTIEYNTDLFDGETIQRMLGHFACMVEAIIIDPDTRIAHLPLLTDEERRLLLTEWNDVVTSFPRDESIQRLFEEQAERTPDNIAIVFGDEQLTYRELNARANRLAHYLRDLGVGLEVAVGFMLEKSAGMVVSLLAILKAGGVYVPLDPSYPLERLDFMLQDARLSVLITESSLLDNLPAFFGQVVCLDSDAELIEGASEENPASVVTGENLAYIIYTSGSTGLPKGISITHRAVVRLVRDTNYIHIQPTDRIAQGSSATFDAATFELWGALLNGAQLVGISREVALSPADLAAEIRSREISILFLTTALFNQIAIAAPQAFSALRELLFGGEAVEPKWVRKVLAEGRPERLLHVYGPTESTTYATWHEVEEVAPDATTIPIGGPLANTQAYVLDKNFEPVPVRVPGELFIGGDGLARGYLQRPALTAEKFVPHPFSSEHGARLYRTGDLVRRLPDGQIEFLGRADNQVKVRGFRIELEEIEAVLRAHPSVEEVSVLAREDGAEERRLVAYLACNNGDAPSASEWRRFVGAKLPEYMIPSIFMVLEKLPLTSSGKVDRRALPAPDQTRPELAQMYAAPTSPTEMILAGAWAEVLGVERVGVHDSFFELGGDSLMAIQVVAKAREHELPISIQQLFQYPTIAQLSQQLLRPEGDGLAFERVPPFGLISDEDRSRLPDDVEDAYPLTRMQAGMVYHSEYAPGTAIYHEIFSFHLQAPLDPELLRSCFEELMGHHPVLRTSFDLSNYSEPLQLVHKHMPLPFELIDLTHLTEEEQQAAVIAYIEGDKSKIFDWASPLLSLVIQRRSHETFQFTMNFHHAIFDGWSLSSFINDLFQYYISMLNEGEGALSPPPAIDYRDFVALERAAMQSEEQQRFWLEKLSDARPTLVPRWSEGKLKADAPPEVIYYDVPLSAEISQGLRRLSNEANVPLKSVVLAAHFRVLSHLSGHDEVITGYATNGRPEEPDGDRMVGMFLNTLPLVLHLSGGSWVDLARATFEAEREMLPFRRFPLSELQRLVGARSLFDAGFNYTHFHVAQGMLHLPGLKILGFNGISETSFTLLADFDLDITNSQMRFALKYDAQQFSREQIQAMGGYYLETLKAMASYPHESYRTRSLLSEAELRQQLDSWNETARPYPREQSLHQLFEEQAERTPEAVALAYEGGRLTYAELNARANRLAHYLRERGVGPESVVGIMLERSPEMIVGLLGVLKAGGAYLPLDHAYPLERLRFMLTDARVEVLLTTSALADVLRDEQLRVVRLDEDREKIEQESAENLEGRTSATNLAYVMYTSGSTGTPKGVSVTHRSVVRLVKETDYADFTDEEVFLQLAPLSFDASTFEIWGSLLNGARLAIMPAGNPSLDELARALEDYRVTTLWLTAGLFHQMVETQAESLRSLRQLLAGGDVLSPAHVRKLLEDGGSLRLINGYGPTEGTTFTCCHTMTAPLPAGLPVPIGRPIANTQVYVLDAHLRPVPVGTNGELFIGGDGLARGYLNRPDLTAERFIPHPYSKEPGARLYRTGDLVRRQPSGLIEFVGRSDFQVKVRGHRIELGEIEAALGDHPGVSQAVVAAHIADSDKLLIAYVEASREAATSELAAELRLHLKERLPDYMMPARFVILDEMPLTPNGKVDRRALPAPATARPDLGHPYVAPGTAVEEALARIWSGVLGLDRVGIHDDFFELGGNSLSATQLVSQLRRSFEIELPLRALFEHPTISELALVFEDALVSQVDELTDEEAERLLEEGF
ncbi:MAG TPA: amino acid adenylation domain-containing protein [Pyrinomonadaceae bacterium]